AVMFGGGYDASHDATDANGTVFTDTATTGNTIYMVNALNGDLLWSATDSNNNDFAEMKYPIPSDLTLIDTNGDGITNRLYVGDIGGQVWRVNLSGADSTSGSRIADLASTTNSERRRFFYPPLWTKSDDKTDEIIVIGSGTRQNPLETVVENRLYVFLDNGTEVDENDLSSVALDSDNHNDKSDGWYLELSEGEKVLSAAIVDEMDDEKIVSFATYIPVLDTSTDPCANKQGQSYLYTMSLNTAKGVFEVDTNGSLLGINVDPDVDTTVRSIATRTGISSGPKKVYSAEADSASKTGITDGYIDPIPTGTNKSESLYWKQVH
ncbi:MAG: hypothetical protein KAH84_12310, partial [Thiomargarita sp.]|nr:hypothetical protein [Thiomargarita sp.]